MTKEIEKNKLIEDLQLLLDSIKLVGEEKISSDLGKEIENINKYIYILNNEKIEYKIKSEINSYVESIYKKFEEEKYTKACYDGISNFNYNFKLDNNGDVLMYNNKLLYSIISILFFIVGISIIYASLITGDGIIILSFFPIIIGIGIFFYGFSNDKIINKNTKEFYSKGLPILGLNEKKYFKNIDEVNALEIIVKKVNIRDYSKSSIEYKYIKVYELNFVIENKNINKQNNRIYIYDNVKYDKLFKYASLISNTLNIKILDKTKNNISDDEKI